MSKRLLLPIITVLILAAGTAIAILLAKGYRFSPQKGMLSGTGIISVTSLPDQASVYLDNHLTTATNATINSLIPKTYSVKITKEGFIPWEKQVLVREGLVTDIKATLFRSIPSVYPLTYNGASNSTLSADGQKLLFVIPGNDKKSGIWIWNMSSQAIGFARGGEPHQIANNLLNLDFTKAIFKFSPDTKQILVTLPDRSYLLDDDRLNDPPADVTLTVQGTLNTWKDAQNTKDLTKLALIKDLSLRQIASSAANLKWSPDETKFFIPDQSKAKITVYDLVKQRNYEAPFFDNLNWLPDSEHLIVVESNQKISPTPAASPNPNSGSTFPFGKISIMEVDGGNLDEIYAGNFDPSAVYAWPDSSRLVIISSFPIATANQPNLYGINLK